MFKGNIRRGLEIFNTLSQMEEASWLQYVMHKIDRSLGRRVRSWDKKNLHTLFHAFNLGNCKQSHLPNKFPTIFLWLWIIQCKILAIYTRIMFMFSVIAWHKIRLKNTCRTVIYMCISVILLPRRNVLVRDIMITTIFVLGMRQLISSL
jgi:hypothetical protein